MQSDISVIHIIHITAYNSYIHQANSLTLLADSSLSCLRLYQYFTAIEVSDITLFGASVKSRYANLL